MKKLKAHDKDKEVTIYSYNISPKHIKILLWVGIILVFVMTLRLLLDIIVLIRYYEVFRMFNNTQFLTRLIQHVI